MKRFLAIMGGICAMTLLSQQAAPAEEFSVCALTPDSRLVATSTVSGTIAFDLIDHANRILGRQIVLSQQGQNVDQPLLSKDLQREHAVARVGCNITSGITFKRIGITDQGPDVNPRAVYVSRRYLIVSFFAFYQSISAPERYKGLPNQQYFVQLDDGARQVVMLSGVEPQEFNIRMSIAQPASYRITFGYVVEGTAQPFVPVAFLDLNAPTFFQP